MDDLYICLVVSTPLENMKINWDDYSQIFPIYGKLKNVPKPPTSNSGYTFHFSDETIDRISPPTKDSLVVFGCFWLALDSLNPVQKTLAVTCCYCTIRSPNPNHLRPKKASKDRSKGSCHSGELFKTKTSTQIESFVCSNLQNPKKIETHFHHFVGLKFILSIWG